jgi:hypothetical protein
METEGVCPYCGQPVSFSIDEGGLHKQRYVEDCSVCCRPIELEVAFNEEGDDAAVYFHREDD